MRLRDIRVWSTPRTFVVHVHPDLDILLLSALSYPPLWPKSKLSQLDACSQIPGQRTRCSQCQLIWCADVPNLDLAFASSSWDVLASWNAPVPQRISRCPRSSSACPGVFYQRRSESSTLDSASAMRDRLDVRHKRRSLWLPVDVEIFTTRWGICHPSFLLHLLRLDARRFLPCAQLGMCAQFFLPSSTLNRVSFNWTKMNGTMVSFLRRPCTAGTMGGMRARLYWDLVLEACVIYQRTREGCTKVEDGFETREFVC